MRSGVPGIWRFSIVWLDDVIFPVKVFIPYHLHCYLTVLVFKNCDHSHVLVFPFIDGNLKDNGVVITIYIINHLDVVNVVVTIQVKVIDFGILAVKASFKAFECF
ncbi:hypothetical protein DSECCO2_462240 [anaerobic digester metagenome]